MKFKKLLDFIEFENNRAISYSKYIKDRERPYIRTVKLMEEIGELCNEIIAYGNYQRKEKQAFSKTNLEEEFADVVIVTLMLAKTLGVDISRGIENKIEKINKRYKKLKKNLI